MESQESQESQEDQETLPEGSLNNIWEDDMIEKITNKENGKSSWRCKWCSKVFSGWNATKALQHVTKTTKVDIKPCTAYIDKYHSVLYEKLAMKNNKKKSNNEECHDIIDRMITSHNDVTATTLDSSKNIGTKRSSSFNSSTISSKKQKSFLDTGSVISHSSSAGDKTVQRLLYDGPNPSGESRCTMAVADMIHGCGLPFTLASHPKFRKVLQLAKLVGSNYKPPNRQAIAGPLLDLNYDAYLKKIQEELQKEINEFGVAFYGDGATVKKCH